MDLLRITRELLDTGPLCNACLGRVVADRSFGLTNIERGKALRVTAAIDEDIEYEHPDPDACWVCEGHCSEYETWAERVAEEARDYEFDTYQVGTRVPPLIEENDRLLREDAGLSSDAGESFKSAFNREVGKRVGALTDSQVDFERPDILAVLNLERGDVDLQINPAFVYGRYRKIERDIPQTEWPCRECGGSGKQFGEKGEVPCEHCDGEGYLYPTSVEEEVSPHIKEAMNGEEALFHGAGREDVDALMLGTGRPFVVEVKKPAIRMPDIETLQKTINDHADGVEVDGLQLATHTMVERVKELDASKVYRATVQFDNPIDSSTLSTALDELEGTTIEQFTPQRVDHRRASQTRTRDVYTADGELIDETTATITIDGEGGLYIKELVSGDDGRTTPSLAGLVNTGANVTELDVIAVEGEEEEFEQEDYLIV